MAKKSMFVYEYNFISDHFHCADWSKASNVNTNDESVFSVAQAGQLRPIRQEPAPVK